MKQVIKVTGFVSLDVPSTSSDVEVMQEWLNRFSLWVKDAQEELDVPFFEDVEAYIEDIDFLVVD